MKTKRTCGIGTWLSIGSPVIAELASECGFDWLLLDLEHGCISEAGVFSCLQAAKNQVVTVIVRVPQFDAALIARVLDWGAGGIMLPHVSDAAQAKSCVQAMRYAPHGKRGFSSSARTFRYGLKPPENISEYEQPLFLAQIENYEGVRNCAEIAAVDGVDILFVGPADLRLDLSSRDPVESFSYEDALAKVNAAGSAEGKQTGILVRNPGDLPSLRKAGFSCLAIGSDLAFLKEGFLSAIQIALKPTSNQS